MGTPEPLLFIFPLVWLSTINSLGLSDKPAMVSAHPGLRVSWDFRLSVLKPEASRAEGVIGHPTPIFVENSHE